MAGGGLPFGLTAEHEIVTSILESLRALPALDDDSVDRSAVAAAFVCLLAADDYLKAVLVGAEPSPEAARLLRRIGDEHVRTLHEVNTEDRERLRSRASSGRSA